MVIWIVTGINQMKKVNKSLIASLQIDRLSMEQGKMADKCSSVDGEDDGEDNDGDRFDKSQI